LPPVHIVKVTLLGVVDRMISTFRDNQLQAFARATAANYLQSGALRELNG
jgi:hypothetical protein